ncbi:type 1 glutamine amidotransferase [Thermocrispum municipale]|jgi:GMP synthase (glutamine-hydrolysing)|uniref:type 1 glutamine amidotransferase n=1 Tax=Thermocrispum municipale TaxID=37926 RepID=UPI000693A1B0|nr:type 1 glutamine amidotransferase [Thermocrispum municipale]
MTFASPQRTERPTVLVVQPDELVVVDRFGTWLAEAGVDLRLVRPWAGEDVPEQVTDAGLLVLGGRMSANDDDEHPWLGDIRRLLRHAVASARPTLGICLGGQLLAKAMGGTVELGDRGVEAGAVRVHWRPEAEDDPLFTGLPSPLLAVSGHRDMISSLPSDATWLGYSDLYPHQAFRAGPRAWGVQFHPEASVAAFRTWRKARADSDPETVERMRVGERELERLDHLVAAHCRRLATRFCDHVQAQWRQDAPARV